jgi:hypothetical protein
MSEEPKEIKPSPDSPSPSPKRRDESRGDIASPPNRPSPEAQPNSPVTKPKLTARISDFFARVRNIVLSMGTIALVIAIAWVLWSETRNPIVYIEPFEVPESINKTGYSGVFMARCLIDNMTKIRIDANTSMASHRIALGDQTAFGDVRVSGTTISLASVVQYLQSISGKSHKVTGDLTALGDQIELTVRIVGEKPKTIHGKPAELDSMLLSAAEYVMEGLQPVLLANYLFEKKRSDDAIETIKLALSNSPPSDPGRAYTLWGWIYFEREDFEGSAAMFRRAVERDSKAGYAYTGWGDALGSLGKLKEATEKYRRALELQANDSHTVGKLMDAYRRLSDWKGVIDCAKRATKLDPDNITVYFYWGEALSKQGKDGEAVDKYETGGELIDRVFVTHPEADKRFFLENCNLWVYSLIRVGRYKEAIDRCDIVLKVCPGEETFLKYKAMALHHLKSQQSQ